MADKDDLPYIVVERRSGGFSSFLLGALIGAGLALLYAPRSGKETRREIADGAQRLRDASEEAIRRAQKAMTDSVDDLKDQVNARIESARQAMDAGREAARATRADLDRRVREAAAAHDEPSAPKTATPRPGIPYGILDGEEDDAAKPRPDEPSTA
jgi:gas vesicle protein